MKNNDITNTFNNFSKIDMSNYFISKATIDDIDKIMMLEDNLDIKILSKNNILEDMKNEHFVYFLLNDMSKNKTIGYIAISYVIDTMDIISIVIEKNYQKKGFASYLLEYIIDFAKKNNIVNILLEVRSTNIPAIKLYEKFKFNKINIRKNYYTSPLEDALIYQLKII